MAYQCPTLDRAPSSPFIAKLLAPLPRGERYDIDPRCVARQIREDDADLRFGWYRQIQHAHTHYRECAEAIETMGIGDPRGILKLAQLASAEINLQRVVDNYMVMAATRQWHLYNKRDVLRRYVPKLPTFAEARARWEAVIAEDSARLCRLAQPRVGRA